MTPQRSTIRQWYTYVLVGILAATLGTLLTWSSSVLDLSDRQLTDLLRVLGIACGCNLMLIGGMLTTRYVLLLLTYDE